MYNSVSTEIIARGKEAEDKAWREKQAERFKELGWEPPKVYMYWVVKQEECLLQWGRISIHGKKWRK